MWLPVDRTSTPELEVTGLVPGLEYTFRVKAVNKEGESEPLETLAPIVAKDPFTVPSAPRNPEAIDWSQTHFELAWKEPLSDGGAPSGGYASEKRDKYSGGMWERVAEISDNICRGKVMNLIENLEYQFRILAFNKAGFSEPSEPTKPMVAKARFVPPKIDRRNFRDITISAGSMLKFDVGVTGEPTPAVQWTYGGMVLK